MELHWMKVYPGNLLMRAMMLPRGERGLYYEAVFHLWQKGSMTRVEMEDLIGPMSEKLCAQFNAHNGDKIGLDWLEADRAIQHAAATKNSRNRSGKRKSTTGISTGKSTRITTPVPYPVPILNVFEQWYKSYDKNRGKKQAREQWSKLSEAEQQACVERTPLFLTANPERKFRPDPERYLKNRRWEDDVPPGGNGVHTETETVRKKGWQEL